MDIPPLAIPTVCIARYANALVKITKLKVTKDILAFSIHNTVHNTETTTISKLRLAAITF